MISMQAFGVSKFYAEHTRPQRRVGLGHFGSTVTTLVFLWLISAVTPAFALDSTNGKDSGPEFTCPFNLSGNPAIALRNGFTAEQVPIVFQLIGRHFDEAMLVRAGVAYQTATEWHRVQP